VVVVDVVTAELVFVDVCHAVAVALSVTKVVFTCVAVLNL
tara:strand:- start:38 stop:157 length:120 start_codon:yes stop_codon:yes gene_type:complete